MKHLDRAFRGKKVLITGQTGFKGGWLSLWLNELGADLVGYALPPDTTPSLFQDVDVRSACRSIFADVRDRPKLLQIVEEERPEYVFHLAAQPLVRRSYSDPIGTLETNIMGTANLLDAVRQVDSVRACVVVTSDKCYHNIEKDYAYKETDPLGGYDPYSASKGAAEIVVSSYRQSFFSDGKCGVASVRAGNVIGGGDWAADRIIPDCIRALSRGERVKVRSPNAIRPWQHVLEPLYGYLLLSARLREDPRRFGDAWNFGPMNCKYSVGQLVDDVVKAWGSGDWDDLSQPNNLHEAHNLRLDSTKANVDLKWVPRLDVRQSVDWTVAWYKKHQAGADMRKFTLQQIGEYMNIPSGT